MEPEEDKLEQGRRRFRHFFQRSKKAQGKKKSRQSDQFKSSEQSEKPEIQEASEAPYEPEEWKQRDKTQTPSPSLHNEEANHPDTPVPTAENDLWAKAFQQLHLKLQAKLRARCVQA